MADRAFATLSSKNQIVIPAAIRQLLELQAGDRIEFDIASGNITLKKAKLAKDPYLESMEQVFSEEWNSEEDSRFDTLL
jgi:AbrB family looped-hinge helix DNA binding protein